MINNLIKELADLNIKDLRPYLEHVEDLDPQYICRICHQLPIEPVDCIECDWTFCKSCSDKWRTQRNECPNKCPGDFNTKSSHRKVKDSLAEVLCFCSNKAQGCKATPKYIDVIKHYKVCEFKPAACIESSCPWKGIQKDAEQHKLNCPELNSKECHVCKTKVKTSQLDSHNCILDLKKQFQKIHEQYIDYKEQAQVDMKELRAKVDNQANQITTLTMLITQLEEKQKQQSKQSPQKQPQHQQSEKPTSSLQSVPVRLCCQRCTAQLRYWANPSKLEMMKPCISCKRSPVPCRLFCQDCNYFQCQQCQIIPIYQEDRMLLCPMKHPLKEFEANPLLGQVAGGCCSSCEGLALSARVCAQCQFILCNKCLMTRYRRQQRTECPECPQQ